jgi:hypothetical protein
VKAHWTIAHDQHLLVVTPSGNVTSADFEECLTIMTRYRIEGYRRILDLSWAALDLGAEGTTMMVRRLADAGAQGGALALVVPPALSSSLGERVDKHLLQAGGDGQRPSVQVFAATDGARQWLASLGAGKACN